MVFSYGRLFTKIYTKFIKSYNTFAYIIKKRLSVEFWKNP